ncbi:hypothetical protein [Azospirillum soli]|uniref:hypothetical protein n=1 Tax=Azospirillum soli TaxID=1304799 RepID=UPI001AE75B00|nr:hypothetical protein [Azospirillum soli]MBP2314911.1 rubrerythrin [Azospirillum soli]
MMNQIEAAQIEAASRALAELNAAPLTPALSGCPDCGTAHMITSPSPLGPCPDCGAELKVLSRPPAATPPLPF